MTQYNRGKVIEAKWITPRTRAIGILADAFNEEKLPPGVDLVVDTGAGERHYSVSNLDREPGVAYLTVVTHGGGPGALWAANVSTGTEVRFMISKQQAIVLNPSASWHLFFGDETSVGSSLDLMWSVADRSEACFEVVDSADRWPEVGEAKVKWVFRGNARPGKSTALLDELPQYLVPDGCTVYVTGETWLCAVVSSHFRQMRGFPSERVHAVPYWKFRPPHPKSIPELE
jgi:NADPH-dependent ferric siderophore reductase